jgi:uncharacterized coiled-coil protein SlyX
MLVASNLQFIACPEPLDSEKIHGNPLMFAGVSLRSSERDAAQRVLQEHRNVAEQQSTIAELKTTVAQQQKQFAAQQATAAQQQKQIKALTATLRK